MADNSELTDYAPCRVPAVALPTTKTRRYMGQQKIRVGGVIAYIRADLVEWEGPFDAA